MLVGPSRANRGCLGCPPRSILRPPPYQCTGTPRARDARHTRSAKTHVAGHAPEHVRQEAGPSEHWSHEFGPISNRRPRRLLHARRLRSQSPPHPRRTPQPPPGTRLGPSHYQVKRPNAARPPASRARLPPSMAPSNAPGIALRPSSPPRRARARLLGSRPSGPCPRAQSLSPLRASPWWRMTTAERAAK